MSTALISYTGTTPPFPSRTGSLGRKIGMVAALCLTGSLVVTGWVVGLSSSRDAEAAAHQAVKATALFAAEQVQGDLQASFQAARSVANTLQVAKEHNTPPTRSQLDATLKAQLAQHPDWVGSYSLWEPNALDGSDAEHVKHGPQDDDTGRFVSYWNRGSGDIAVEPLLDYEKPGANDWYDIPRRTGQAALIEPYLYKIGGKDMLITSLVEPIMVKGRFVGIVGIDLLLSGLQNKMGQIKTLDGAKVMLISSGGKYVSHPEPASIGGPAQNLSDAAMEAVRQGKPFDDIDAQGHVRVLAPVSAGANTQPWSLCIEYSADVARAPAMATLRKTALTAAVAASVAIMVLLTLLHRLMRPVRELADTMSALANGDSTLRVTLPVRGHDELGLVAQGFNAFVGKLRSTFESVRNSSHAVDASAAEIATGNADLSARTEQQAAHLEEISSSIQELSQGVQTNTDTAQRASQLASGAAANAQRSQQVMQDAITAMEQLAQSSQRIADITSVIDGIAFQTNILALNAAVEAARAGEYGRGFAVVASEVRTLAQRAANAAKDIKGLIDESTERVNTGTERIKASGHTLRTLVDAVTEAADMIHTISHASLEQAQGIAHIEGAMHQLDDMNQQNAALAEQTAASASSLKHQTQQLGHTLSDFI